LHCIKHYASPSQKGKCRALTSWKVTRFVAKLEQRPRFAGYITKNCGPFKMQEKRLESENAATDIMSVTCVIL